jgi:hypothetical protein
MQPNDYVIEDALTLTTGEFLNLMFRRCHAGYIEVCYLAPEEAKLYPRVVTQFRPLPIGPVVDYPPAIAAKNAQGYGVYFGTTVSGVAYEPEERKSEKTGRPYTAYFRHKEHDATLAPALWADLDNVTTEDGYARLIRAPVPPSIVVRSGGGLHGYWLLNTPVQLTPETREDFKRALHGLINIVGGDPATRDLARIMRMPGTVNTKPGRNGAMCEVLDCLPAYYDYAVLGPQLRRFAPRETPRPTRILSYESTDPNLPRYVEDFKQYGAPQGERNHRLYVCACFYRDHGYTQMQAENDLAPVVTGGDFSHEEAMRTISSAYREPARPALPRNISARMAIGDVKRD